MLYAACGELDHLDRVSAGDDQVAHVEAHARLGADEEALDVLRPLDDAGESLLPGRKPGGPAVIAPSPTAAASDRTRSTSIWCPQSRFSLTPQEEGESARRCTARGRRPLNPGIPTLGLETNPQRLTF